MASIWPSLLHNDADIELTTGNGDLTKEDISDLRGNLAAAYQCPLEDITYSFQKILDDLDDDRDNFLMLVYTMNKPGTDPREVFSIKIRIPEEIKIMVKHLKI